MLDVPGGRARRLPAAAQRECDLALAGGVTIELPHGVGYRYEEGEILSPDGHCRAFDAEASGTVFGSGAGIVALRRIHDALVDGDHIYAVIKGSAVNNDGSAKVGYLAPSVDGQTAAVREAIGVSGVPPERIGYLEAHGTGTPVGDPIEVAALTQAFRGSTQRTGVLRPRLGQDKHRTPRHGGRRRRPDQGRQGAGAPAAPTVVALLAAQPRHRLRRHAVHREYDATAVAASADGPRAAAVNSLGVGGTNAHVILEEAPVVAGDEPDPSPQLLVLSARTRTALGTAARNLAAHLEGHPHLPLADVAFTLQTGRRAFACRRALVAADHAAAISALSELSPPGPAALSSASAPAMVFMFPGQVRLPAAVAQDLFDREPAYSDAVRRCADTVRAAGGPDIGHGTGAATEADGTPSRTNYEAVSALRLFAVEYALAALYRSWGVAPAAVVGCGAGEIVAAHLAGVLSLADALALTERLAEVAGPRSGEAMPTAAPEREIEALAEFAASLTLSRPERPIVSGLTADWGGAEMATAAYWTDHLRGVARFDEAVRCAAALANPVFLEVGPGSALSAVVRRTGVVAQVITSTRDGADRSPNPGDVLAALGVLWTAGADIDWAAVPRHGRRRVSLPTYPFAPSRHWIAPAGELESGADHPAAADHRAPLSA